MLLLAVSLLAACGGNTGQDGGTGGGTNVAVETAETTGAGTTIGSSPDGPGELADTRWVLVSLRGRDPIEGTEITLRFRDDSIRGKAGCNSYGTEEVRTAGDAFRVGPVVSTQIGCKGPVGEQESAYLEALQTPGTYRVAGDRLEIRDRSGDTILVFEKEAS